VSRLAGEIRSSGAFIVSDTLSLVAQRCNRVTFADEATHIRGLSLDHAICLSKTATPVEVLEALHTFATRLAPGEHR
jgi:hypothetical protein